MYSHVSGAFVESAGRLVIFGILDMAISKVFRNFLLPLIWHFFKKRKHHCHSFSKILFFGGIKLCTFKFSNCSTTCKESLTKFYQNLFVYTYSAYRESGQLRQYSNLAKWESGFDSVTGLRDFCLLQNLQSSSRAAEVPPCG